MGARVETSVALIEKLVRDLTNVPHEYPMEGKEGKYHAFVSNAPTMARLNMSGVKLGAARSTVTLTKARNYRMIFLLAAHVKLSITTNSYSLPEVIPAFHLKMPNSELLMRHDQSVTEVRSLQDPHLPYLHQCAMKRSWEHSHRRIVQCVSQPLHPK